MNQYIIPVTLAALGGLTFLAYHHPKGYFKVAGWLANLFTVIALIGGVWDFTLGTSFSSIAGFIEPNKITIARDLIFTNLFIPLNYFWLLIFVNFYLYFLQKLPDIIKDDQK